MRTVLRKNGNRLLEFVKNQKRRQQLFREVLALQSSSLTIHRRMKERID